MVSSVDSPSDILVAVVEGPDTVQPERRLLHARLAERIGALLHLDPDQLAVDRPLIEYGLDRAALAHVLADLSGGAAEPLTSPPGAVHLGLHALAERIAGRGAMTAAPERMGGCEPVAIVGMACRFPQAPDPGAYWQLLRDGRCARSEVPLDRWDAGQLYHPDPRHPGTAHSRFGYFLPEVDRFEPGFFGISPREAQSMDPQQRLMLELTWEALEDAGQVIDGLRGSRTAVFAGLIWNDYATLSHRLGFDAIAQHTVTSSHYSLLSNRVSHVFGLQGPSLSLDVACSSGLVAVHLACQSLRSGESTMALAGGVNLIIAPDSYLVVAKMGTLAADGLCKVFDARADGFGRGEGGGVLVLKTLSRALRDGDRIYCVVRGSATNHNGDGERLTQPNLRAQQAVLLAAYDQAQVPPDEVVYVEAHGTGTRAGDPVEAQALGRVLGQGRPADRPLLIGSAKSNLGHLEGASGLVGLMKAALALRHRTVPPSLHFEIPNPQIAFAELNLKVADHLIALPPGGAPLVMGVNAFGLGGSNCHVVLQEHAPPVAPVDVPDGDEPQLITLSAHRPESLRLMARELGDHLRQHPQVPLHAVAFTRAARRAHLAYRLAVVGRTAEECATRLHEAGAVARVGPATIGPRPRAPQRPIVLVFSGQGGQWIGMGAALMTREPVFRAAMEECAEAFAPYLEAPLLAELHTAADPARFERFEVMQPLLCALQVALARLWASYGVVPAAVLGQSMGEVAAAHVAGALSLADTARIICRRSALSERYARRGGGMAVVELTEAEAAEEVAARAGEIAVTSVNGPRSTVLAGDRDALAALCERLEARGVFARFVQTSIASHTHHVDPVLPWLREALAGVAPRRAVTPIYSTVLGRACTGAELDADYWTMNLRQPVRLMDATRAALDDDHDLFVEIGPHPLLGARIEQFAAGIGRRVTALPTLHRKEPERRTLLETLGKLYTRGVTIDWSGVFHTGGEVLALPGYRWQRARYWADGMEAAARGDGGSIGARASRAAPEAARPSVGAEHPPDIAVPNTLEHVQEALHREVVELLLLPADVGVDATPLVDLGIDSTAALRLRARCDQLFGWAPAITAMLRDASIGTMAEAVWAEICQRAEHPPVAPPGLDLAANFAAEAATSAPEPDHVANDPVEADDAVAWIAELSDELVEHELLALLEEEALE